MPLVRTAVTAGDHIDWMTVSPEAIRLTLSLKSFQNARNWPAFLASVSTPMVMSISALVMLPLSGYLYLPVASTTIAASMMPIDGNVEDGGLALELGVEQFGPGADRALDQVGADAERVGVVDGRDQRHPFGRRLREFAGVLAVDEHHLLRRGALVADHLAVGQLALGEDRRDVVEFLDLLGVHRAGYCPTAPASSG